ncbi:transcriptional regulator [Actinomadura sp. NBRC 104425]|uniref:GlxA family transcriptional regulator n=1 Tax=Actinomadura sp. NBRC 104425 TaxID=3032204 RepID=UPI0024A5EE8B|nr:GlxA family transcriptional regulator [Actinomadura sp. NBRC 104425]GLZ11921.1 transcriptional regulator [Actinomadura sp. NBRC 104425]
MREVLIVVYDGVQSLDVTGPAEVFDGAARLRPGGYRVRLASPDGRAVTTSSGLRLGVHTALAAAGPVDTLVVAGGPPSDISSDGDLVAGVRTAASAARRVTSVCTGAFVLAAAGLLEGRRATTHWAYCDRLAAVHPGVAVAPDAIWVRDGPVVTSAGVTAGVDLALALVEEDHGAAVAREIARWLVVFMQRPGGQSQFSRRARTRPVRREALRALLDHIAAEPAADLSVEAMAARLSMSPRHFSRVFADQVGVSPGRYVEEVRVEAARCLLESGDDGVDTVARLSGFGSAETMRRAFLRHVGVPPAAYRDRFRTTARPVAPRPDPAGG